MMLAQKSCNLLKICPQLRRALHPASVVWGKVSPCSVSQQDVLPTQQLRSLCSKPDEEVDLNSLLENLQSKIMKKVNVKKGKKRKEVNAEKDNEKEPNAKTDNTKEPNTEEDLNSVFRNIQEAVGIKRAVPDTSAPTSSSPTSETSSSPSDELDPDSLSGKDEQKLREAITSTAGDWRELSILLDDGQEMSGVALAMFVEENITKCPYLVLCKLMACYGQILDKDSRQFTLMLDEGIRRMSEESLLQGLIYIQALQKIPEDKLQSKYFELSLEKIKPKIVANNNPMELVFALSVLRKNEVPDFMALLDTKIINLLPDMTLENVVDLLYVKALDRQRNPIMIRTMVSKLNDSPFDELKLQQVVNLFYSCGVLNIYNPTLLSKLSKHATTLLTTQWPNREAWQCTHSILFSCKNLHWKDENLMQQCEMKARVLLRFSPVDLMEDVVSMCHLGFRPTEIVKGLEEMEAKLTKVKETRPLLWMKYVHATAFHRLASADAIRGVLQPDFYTKLLEKDKGYSVMQMLLNLQGCLELDMGQRGQPLKDQNQFSKSIQVKRGKNSIAYPIEAAFTYISTNVSGARCNKYGHRIDFDVEFRLSQESTEMGKAVVRVLEFNEMVQAESGVRLTGQSAMAIRHLNKSENKPVLVVPYYKWKGQESGAVNAARLETMLRDANNAYHSQDKPAQATEASQKPNLESASA